MLNCSEKGASGNITKGRLEFEKTAEVEARRDASVTGRTLRDRGVQIRTLKLPPLVKWNKSKAKRWSSMAEANLRTPEYPIGEHALRARAICGKRV
jgi:hypothetical protein